MSRTTARIGARLLAVAAVLVAAAPARADSLPLCALGQDGVTVLATGSIAVEQLSSTQAAITLTLTNTNPGGGGITGFGFCNPNSALGAQVTAITELTTPSGTGGPANFGLLTGVQAEAALGLATVPGTCLGVGGSGPGLAVGQSGTFVLNVQGTDVTALTAASLLAGDGIDAQLRLSLGLGLDPNLLGCQPVDCVPCPPVNCPPPGSQTHAAPAPPGVVLAGLGLGCMLLGRLRRAGGPRPYPPG